MTPADLSFTSAHAPQGMIDTFATKFELHAKDTFSTDTSANYTPYVNTGTTTINIGSGSASFSGAGAGFTLLKAGEALVAPYMYAEINVTGSISGGPVPVVGFGKDSSNYAWAYVFGGNFGMEAKIGGVQVGAVSLSAAPSTPFKMAMVVCWPEMHLWVDSGSGYTFVGRTTLSGDFRTMTVFQTWKAWFGFDRGAGQTGTVSYFRSGYVGGIGVRDFKPLTYLDGRPYIDNGKCYFMTTCAIGDGFKTNHTSIMSIDTTSYAAAIESMLFFNIAAGDPTNPAATKDTCTSLYGGQILRDEANGQWIIVTNGWGLGDVGTGVQLWKAATSSNILSGVWALDAYQLVVPTSKSVYDNGTRFDGTNWHIVCAETDAATSWSNFSALYLRGATLDTLSRIATDGGHEAEGLNWVRVDGTWYATSGGTSGPHYWDSSLSYIGSLASNLTLTGLNTSFSSYGSHFPVIGLNRSTQTEYIAALFSDDEISSMTATKGKLVVMAATPLQTGNEWTYGPTPPTSGTLSATSHTTTTAAFSWTASTGTGTVTDQLQKSPHSADTWTNVTGATTSPATATGLTAGTAYDFRLQVTDDNGTAYSNTVTVTTWRALTVTATKSGADVVIDITDAGTSDSYELYKNGSLLEAAAAFPYTDTGAASGHAVYTVKGITGAVQDAEGSARYGRVSGVAAAMLLLEI